MPASEPKGTQKKNLPGIFISYRRSDNPDATGRIYDRLVAEFGKARVFKDVDSIPLGQDFRGHLNDVVGGCAAVLAIIGQKWIDTRNGTGHRRLDDPDDFVRIELEAALARDIPVVPVLVAHAPMPGTTELPASLASMAFRQSIEVRPDPDFHHDATRLVLALRAIIDPNVPQDPAPDVEGFKGAVAHRTPGGRWVWPAAFAVAALAAIALSIPATKHLHELPPPEIRTDIVTPVTDNPESFALSPDGRQIVYVARSEGSSRLWLRPLSKGSAQPLAGTEGATSPFWSPDSRSIAYFANGSLMRVDLDGGQPRTIAAAGSFGDGTWNARGDILYVGGPAYPIMRVSANGGAPVAVTKQSASTVSHRQPMFLPDGQHFLYLAAAGSAPGVYLASLQGGAPTRLITGATAVACLPSGWLLKLSAGSLVAQKLDVDKGMLIGDPVTLATGVHAASASATGLIAFRSGGGGQRQLTWVNRSGAVLGTIGAPDATLFGPRVSPDGRQVAFSRISQGKQDVWLQDATRTSRVSFSGTDNQFPVWSPDGSQLVYTTAPGAGENTLYRKLINGGQGEERLLGSDLVKFPSSWSRDGRYLLFFSFDTQTSADLWVMPMTGEHKPFVFLNTSSTEVWGQFSPDGQWVAFQSNQSGRDEIYLRRFSGPGGATPGNSAPAGQWQVSTTGGVHPAWRADGKEIFYIDPSGTMMAAPIALSGSTIVPGAPVELFRSQVYGGGIDSAQGRQYDVAADGRFLINRVLDTAIAPITLIQNWNPDARK
jgi:Tol biopolymer transport system component